MGADKGSAENVWCVALESGADSGWPGTDWIEDLVLRTAGPDVYDAWVAGEQKWNSPEIKAAFEEFGKVLDDTYGGATTVNSTNFGDGGNPLFTDPPGCLFHHQASFITDFFKEQGGAADGEFDFFPMPDINPEFTLARSRAPATCSACSRTSPQAKDLLKYLTTAEAQQIWVDRGGALSANTKVTNYPDDVSKRSAETLTSAKIFRFDGGDLMPNAMKAAFFRAMVDFAEDPSKLDAILTSLDEVAAGAYAPVTPFATGEPASAGSPGAVGGGSRWSNGSSRRRSSLIGVPLVLIGYILLVERLLPFLPGAAAGQDPAMAVDRARRSAFLVVFLIYPTINTIVLSFMDKFSKNFVGLENYIWFFGDPSTLEALRNSAVVGRVHDRRSSWAWAC